jgi:NADH-quinone oxidoreductase subunit L
MFYAVGVGAIFASQFHLFSHALFKGLLFLSAGAVIQAVGTRDMRLMGGLGKQMPFVRFVFIVGALALAGIPITNGFFSKELVLEGGLILGPLWAYIFMLIGAGLTALYTTRMVSMVFFGRAGGVRSGDDAGQAMRVALILVAIGTLVSWLMMGPLSQMLASTLPYQQIHSSTTWEFVSEILTTPATWLALAVVGLGIIIWLLQDRLVFLARPLKSLTELAQNDLGFEWLNQQLIRLVQGLAAALCRTQTGQLNWNVAGIVGGLVVLLAILVWGTR